MTVEYIKYNNEISDDNLLSIFFIPAIILFIVIFINIVLWFPVGKEIHIKLMKKNDRENGNNSNVCWVVPTLYSCQNINNIQD